jgi:non-canonical (house-cleaning) NTP pyrophosphatase
MIIRLGSTNSVKIRATQKAFRLFWPKARVIPISVTSTVSEHPSSLREIARGARSRARFAGGEADFIVGIEAGTFQNRVMGKTPFLITLAYITDGKSPIRARNTIAEVCIGLAGAVKEYENRSFLLVAPEVPGG